MSGCDEGDRRARAALAAAVEPGAAPITAAVLEDGAEAVVRRLRRGDNRLDRHGRAQRLLAGVDGAEVLESGVYQSARYICPGDAEWPAVLDDLEAAFRYGNRHAPPPLGLWVRGSDRLDEVTHRSVAVVGARAATDYGSRVAADLTAGLAVLGWTVISGGAYGIDGAAHRGVLSAGGRTIVVLACGVDVMYPKGHALLLSRIAEDGLVVSELPPGTGPKRSRFLARNRLIAGMSRGTVVVEAALRSGALNTAKWAHDIGREVMAVPGPVTSALSDGCHELVRKGGAILVTRSEEVVDAVGDLGRDVAPLRVGDARPIDSLDPIARDVVEALPAKAAASVDELCRDTGLAAGSVIAVLGELALAKFVVCDTDGWRLAGRDG